MTFKEAHALAGELAGATPPDTLKAGEKTLKLNGLGLRKKATFKVYVGGRALPRIGLQGRGRDPRIRAKDKAAQKAAFDKGMLG